MNGRMTLKIKPVMWGSSLTSFPNRKERDDWERHLRKKVFLRNKIMKKIYSKTKLRWEETLDSLLFQTKVNVKPLFDTKGIRRNKHRSIHTEK